MFQSLRFTGIKKSLSFLACATACFAACSLCGAAPAAAQSTGTCGDSGGSFVTGL